MRRMLLVFFIVTFLMGCSAAGMKRSVSESNLENIEKIGVISMLGNNFHGIHIGTTIFTNEYYSAAVGNWEIDKFISDYSVNTLKNTKYKNVGKIEVMRDASSDIYKNGSWMNVNYEMISSLAREQGFDTAIAILMTHYDNTPHHKGGYGFFDFNRFGIKGRCVYSLFTAQVINVRDNKVIAWEWGYPCHKGDEDIPWKNSFDEYTDVEKELIKERLKIQIRNSIDESFKKLKIKQ